MSFVSAAIAGAGLAAQIGGSLLGGSQTAPIPYLDPGVDYRFGPNGVTGLERARQAAFQKEADAITSGELKRFGDLPGAMATKAKQLGDFFATNSGTAPNSGPTSSGMPPSASVAVARDADPKLARVAAFRDQQNDALAHLRSFGDAFGDVNRGVLQDRSNLANVENFRAGSRALVPFEMQASYRAPSYGNSYPAQPNTFADILRGVGKIGTTIGLSGGFGGGGGGFTGTPEGLLTYGSPGYAASLRYGGQK